MADFIKIDGVDDNTNDASNTNTDDKATAYLDSLIGDTNGEGQEASNASAQGGEAEDKSKDNSGEKQAGQSGDSSAKDGGAQQATDQKGKKDEKPANSANAGDLTLQDGTVVKAGAERRFYEKHRLAESQLSMRTNELNQANQSRQRLQDELTNLRNTVQSLQGADPAVVSNGVRLVNDLRRDPVGTLKTLLTEATAAGYTIEGIAQGIDVQSIRNAITEQVKPLLDQRQQQDQQQQSDQAIEQEVQNFYRSFPDASVHDDVIAAVIAKNPQMSLSDAYYQLRNAAIDRGLDWSKPLAPQMASEQQQQPQQTQQKPMPNGRAPSGNSSVAEANRGTVAHESTSTADIVRQAMRENGLKV